MSRLSYGNAAPFDAKGRELSFDDPLPTVMGLNEMHNGHQFVIDELMPTIAPRPDQTDKPPYRVPSMAEIAAIEPNGLQIVSTFSGCGGSCLGFKMAGYRVLWANEFIPAAQDVYRANHPDTILDTRNIRDVTGASILDAIGLDVGEIDVLEGSPPCASFSTAGKREKHWGKNKAYSDTVQRTDDLFFEFVRLLDGIKPKVFVAENVSGLVKGSAKGYFKEILAAMKACGYTVEAKLLDAQWLGVPQARQRIIFVGCRSDLGRAPAFPKPLPYRYSVRDALPWITAQGDNAGFGGGAHSPAAVPSPTIGASPQTGNGTYPPSLVEVRAIRDDRGAFGNGGDITDRPSPTVLSDSVGTHWMESDSTERRKFTIDELKRICAFPDDFILTGTYAQQWERLGRAVPPVMMRTVADAIAKEIFDK